jgi:hypothetical protein
MVSGNLRQEPQNFDFLNEWFVWLFVSYLTTLSVSRPWKFDEKMINAYGAVGRMRITEVLGEKSPKFHLVRHEPYKIWPRIEPGPQLNE